MASEYLARMPQETEAASAGGPRTPAGKRRSSLNALKRGLCTTYRELLIKLRGDDARDYRRLHRDLISLFQPSNPFLSRLVADLTEAWWEKVRRLRLRLHSPAEAFERRQLNARIERRLVNLINAQSLCSEEWHYRLAKALGDPILSPAHLRLKIEATLGTFGDARKNHQALRRPKDEPETTEKRILFFPSNEAGILLKRKGIL